MNEDEKWMSLAIMQAIKAENEGEVPIGAVLVKDGLLIAKAHNQPISKNDPTAHAEIQVIRNAGKIQKNYRLLGTTLYVTLEPCSMCLGAMMHARIDRIFFGAFDYKKREYDSLKDLKNTNNFNHKITINGGILENDCQELLHSFFKHRR
jgi:tRNA(adenine34) deaminase